MNPCRLCGYQRGGAPVGERYCDSCDSNLEITRPVRDQTERRRKKVVRTDEGVFSRWALGYYVRWR